MVIDIGGRKLGVVGDDALTRLRPAFARVEDAGSADATLCVRLSVDPAATPPFDQVATGLNRDADGSFVVVARSPSAVEAWRPREQPQLTLDLSPQALESGDRLAQPAHLSIGAWIGARGQYLMHAAGVALGDRGVLLLGAGGRGKTTTALACAASGLSFLGDDLCIAAPDASGHARHRLHGLYGTAKLNADSLARLGAQHWRALGMTPKGKTVVMLPLEFGFSRSCRLVACVCVTPESAMAYEPQLLSRTEAVRQLARASSPGIGAFGPSRAWLAGLSRIARDVPTFRLGLGWDLQRLVAVISGLCSEHAGPSRPQALLG
jgi:hypothetical protein